MTSWPAIEIEPVRRSIMPMISAQRRCLAGAVAADDGDDFAGGNVERHAVQHVRVAVERLQIADRQ